MIKMAHFMYLKEGIGTTKATGIRLAFNRAVVAGKLYL
jgi:hypothetical protein